MTLPELHRLRSFNTDKGNPSHGFRGKTYLDVYETLFRTMREESFTLLEIGVLFGGSLAMWREYFPNATILGVDINPDASSCVPANALFVNASQTDEATIVRNLKQLPPLGIVIDDGSHYVPHMLESFRFLWPMVRDGGFYVMEDMRISYCGVDMEWPGMKLNQSQIGSNNRSDLDVLLLTMIRDMDNLQGTLRSIEFHPMMIAFKKSIPT